jgi:hypothetical protein
MILFLGDSFTWGQGLEWYYYLENNLMTVDEINKLIPPKHACERLSFEASEYRKKHRFPSLVSKHFDIPYDLGKVGNGGGNPDFNFVLDNIDRFIYLQNLTFIVVQFTHVGRDRGDYIGNPDDLFSIDVDPILNNLEKIKSLYGIEWVTLSWMPETADRVLQKYPNKNVFFEYENKKFNSFEDFVSNINIHTDISIDDKRIFDYHFSKEGSQFIANSIISHIEKHNLLDKEKFNKNNFKIF